MKTSTLTAGARRTVLVNPVIPTVGLVKPTGVMKETGNPQNPRPVKNGKLSKEPVAPKVEAKVVAPVKVPVPAKKTDKAKGKPGRKEGTTVETPKEAVQLYTSILPTFTDKCREWLIVSRSGSMRVCDVRVIAAHLLSNKTRYIMPAYPDGRVETDSEVAKREAAKETLKDMNKSFRKLSKEEKEKWMRTAKPLFNRSFREYLTKIAPVKHAVAQDKRFVPANVLVSITKKGAVHAGLKSTCKDFVVQPVAK